MGEDERGVHEPQSVREVHMERRGERVPLPEGRFDLSSAPGELGVVKGSLPGYRKRYSFTTGVNN
jgi:hypothetical protein